MVLLYIIFITLRWDHWLRICYRVFCFVFSKVRPKLKLPWQQTGKDLKGKKFHNVAPCWIHFNPVVNSMNYDICFTYWLNSWWRFPCWHTTLTDPRLNITLNKPHKKSFYKQKQILLGTLMRRIWCYSCKMAENESKYMLLMTEKHGPCSSPGLKYRLNVSSCNVHVHMEMWHHLWPQDTIDCCQTIPLVSTQAQSDFLWT